jgi:aspartate carbamoyltransferase catalytic subunit
MVGNLRHNPAAHSLIRALAHWDVTVYLVSPPNLRMTAALTGPLKRTLLFVETEDLDSVLDACDVLYVTPMGESDFRDSAEAERARERYRVDRRLLGAAGGDLSVMHPLPLGDEIAHEVDGLPGAAYFRQATGGIWIRMAVLALLLGVL